ncbi:MAG: MarR family transcriptional regulator [Flavobacteriaceae bacterium]|nr:MarR family transcriptional regulator [Flavobacteriaceae bacterium]
MLRTTWNSVVKAYNTEAAKYNFTMVMGFALLSIDPKHGTPSTSLGPKMGMEPTSLSRTLKNLEERELIERHPNPDDGRGVIIKLTDEGKESRDIAKQVVMQFNQKIEEQFGLEKLKTFYEVSQGIQNLISEKKIFNK